MARIALWLALPTAAWSGMALSLGWRRRDALMFRSGVLASYAVAISWTAAASCQRGEIILWGTAIAWFAVAMGRRGRRFIPTQVPYISAIMMAVLLGITAVALTEAMANRPASPMPLFDVRVDGIAKIVATIGCAGCAALFAAAIGGVLAGEVAEGWAGFLRGLAGMAWLGLLFGMGGMLFLGQERFGTLFASPYSIGGYLAPWCLVSALMQTLIVQERRGNFKRASVLLSTLAFFASLPVIFGDLSRPGRMTGLGVFGAMAIGGWWCVRRRRSVMLPRHPIESRRSKEGLIAVMVGLWGAVALSVSLANAVALFPPAVARVLQPGVAIAANAAVAALGLLVLVGWALFPIVSWWRTDPRSLRRNLVRPVGAALFTASALIAVGERRPWWLATVAAAVFAAALLLLEIARGSAVARQGAPRLPWLAALACFFRGPRRPAGRMCAVAGLALGALGIAGYSAVAWHSAMVSPGASTSLAGYRVEYRQGTEAELFVWRRERLVRRVRLSSADQTAIIRTWRDDLRIAVGAAPEAPDGSEASPARAIAVRVAPFANGVWIGLGWLVLGGALLAWP
ncbi:MAG: hypothetical protein HY543_06755, partial [Deltaproteobacteria bacterium]|nr:hypothetical protein [Deltaproteobacteria bacterium]